MYGEHGGIQAFHLQRQHRSFSIDLLVDAASSEAGDDLSDDLSPDSGFEEKKVPKNLSRRCRKKKRLILSTLFF